MLQPTILLSSVVKAVKANAPEILTGLGVTGVITTSYLTGKASYHASRDEDAPIDMSNKEKIQRYWKLYVPAAISGALTIGCIIGASKGNNKRTAAAVTAYSITEKAFSEYKEKVIEEVGKGKEQKFRDQVVQDRVLAKGPTGEVLLGNGKHVLCCELYTHRYFRSEMEALRKAQNDVNAWVVNTRSATLDDFYSLIGLTSTTTSGKLGWEDDRLMELTFTTVLAEDGEPCLAFDYNYVKPLE